LEPLTAAGSCARSTKLRSSSSGIASLFAFQNGILDVRALVFYPFRARALWPAMAEWAVKRLRVNGDRHEALPPSDDEAVVKYFSYEFEHSSTDLSLEADLFHLEPSSIRCPALLKVLESQRLEPDTIYWFFAMMGRMFFPIKELDNWQVFVFLKGVAGSGKSTISQLMRYIYPAEMVGVLSSNAEAKFALSAFSDKHLVICPEAKRKFALPQGDFQSMVSGEEVSVAIKYQTAKMVRWTANMLFCGNELPQWTDTSGSMNRRMLMFPFNVKITSVDTGIGELMEQQLGNFLLRAAISYHQAVLRFGQYSIWDRVDGRPILSEQMHAFSTEVMLMVHPLMNFLVQSGEVELTHRNPELELDQTFVPKELFIKYFHNWCRERGIDKPQWDEDFYRSHPPCPWNIRTCSAAARHGHLALLQWAREQEPPPCQWREDTCVNAAEGGHLAVLQWLAAGADQTPPCPWSEGMCVVAAAGVAATWTCCGGCGQAWLPLLVVATWWSCGGSGPPLSVEYGRDRLRLPKGPLGRAEVAARKRLRPCRRRRPGPCWTCIFAAEGGHLAVLKWARAQEPPALPVDRGYVRRCRLRGSPGRAAVACPCAAAASCGHLDILRWFRTQGDTTLPVGRADARRLRRRPNE
jgi:hypothetical protein